MLIEIYKRGKLKKRLTKCLGTLEWDNEMMYVPQCTLTLPAEYAEYFDGREDVIINVNNKIFLGHLKNNYTLNKEDETIELPLSHIVCEWDYRQISVNHAISDPNDENNKINVVFKGDKVKKSKGNDEGITAADFKINTKDVKKITDEQLIEAASAQAWVLSNGDPVPVTKVDRGKLTNKQGTYDITFSTAKGTSVKIECEVRDNVNLGGERYKSNRADKEKISARRFTIDISEVPNLTSKEIIRISQAKAWVLRHPDQKIGIKIVQNTIVADRGSYTVTFQTVTGKTELTIDVKVDYLDETYSDMEQVVIDKLKDIYNDTNMAYPGWQIDYQDGSEDTLIDYIYSRQGKLEALTKTMENTTDLFWRVGFTGEKLIEIGKFGAHKPYMISLRPSGRSNRKIITEPEITPDYENVINVATVYSAKSDAGMSSLTLREVYNDSQDKELNKLKKDFPVVILHSNVNNERDYTRYITQYPELAPNNELEYAVLDKESIELESGILIEGTYAFNDLGAVTATESNRLTNKQRFRASKTVYKAAIRKLKEARRNYRFECTVEEMPPDVNVGDKIRVLYDNSIWKLEACSNRWKKIIQMDDWFYIEKMNWSIDVDGKETNELTLVKYLKIDRETGNGI